MALTNFGLLTTEQKTAWVKETWSAARNMSFINKFVGMGSNSMIQRITELKKDEKGARAVITLLADLEGDGVAGDRTLENNEEALKSYDQVIRLDQLRHANKHEGKMADQKSVVNFREMSRDVLAYWLAERLDQMAFLTLAGLSYTLKTNGAVRVGSDLPNLDYAADVTAVSARRKLRWNVATASLVAGTGTATTTTTNATDLSATDTPSWDMIVNLKAYAKDEYIRGMREDGGREKFHLFLTPRMMAKLKLDANYLAAVRNALPRSDKNALFTGDAVDVDGVYIHEYRHVPNNSGMATKTGWGAGNNVNGGYALFCGAQALGLADIGDATWVEKGFDYENQQGISLGKITGLKKPVFRSLASGTVEDFGVIRVAVAQ